MRRKHKGLLIALAAMICVTTASETMIAAEENAWEKGYTYNFDYWGDVQYCPDAYATIGVFTGADLGLEKGMLSPDSIFVKDNYLFICDTGNNRIIQIERTDIDKFEIVRIIDSIKGCEVTNFNKPSDIFVDDELNMYVCDKENNRVVKFNEDLEYMLSFTRPIDETFSKDAGFLPSKLVVDKAGRVYCLAENVNKGILKYESDGSFTGYHGATKASYNFYDYIWKKFLSTNAQRAKLESFVPTEYDNVYMDSEGFIFACTTAVSGKKADEPVRRLNLMGNNILIENGNYDVEGDIYFGTGGGYSGPSLLTDVTALESGIYFALDKTRGRLFGYDTQGNLLYAFGGNGHEDGYFRRPVSLEHMGKDLLVLDALSNSITLFTPTEFGNLIYEAIDQYDQGDYITSGQTWEKVMGMDGNYDLAYIGIGRSLMRQEKYGDAMKYFKLKWDDDNYSKAFKQFRKHWVEDNIGWIFLGFFLIFIIPMVIGRIKKVKYEIDHDDLFKR